MLNPMYKPIVKQGINIDDSPILKKGKLKPDNGIILQFPKKLSII